jgi:hypothetical protein
MIMSARSLLVPTFAFFVHLGVLYVKRVNREVRGEERGWITFERRKDIREMDRRRTGLFAIESCRER